MNCDLSAERGSAGSGWRSPSASSRVVSQLYLSSHHSLPVDTGSSQATSSKPFATASKNKLPSGEDEGAEVNEEEEMMRLLGFGNFDSTKGKPVEDNFETAAIGGVKKNKKRVYR